MGIALAGCMGGSTKDTTDTGTPGSTPTETTLPTTITTPAPYESLTGTVVRTRSEDGVVVCTETFELTGTAYTGDCEGCTFAFDLDAVATVGPACPEDPFLTWSDGLHSNQAANVGAGWPGELFDLRLAFWDQDELGTIGPVDEVVARGFMADLTGYVGGEITGPYWVVAGYAGSVYLGNVVFAYDHLAVHQVVAYDLAIGGAHAPVCYTDYLGHGPLDPVIDAVDHTGELSCYGQSFDVWEFTAQAGAVVRLRVDNDVAPNPDDAVGPYLVLSDEADCAIPVEADRFECSAQPPSGAQDPYFYPLQGHLLEATIPATGTYHLLVGGWSEMCAGGAGPYVVRGTEDGQTIAFSLLTDDEPWLAGYVAVEDRSWLEADLVP